MHGMGKGAQALRVCLGVGLKMTTQAPESAVGGGTLAQKLPLLAFLLVVDVKQLVRFNRCMVVVGHQVYCPFTATTH